MMETHELSEPEQNTIQEFEVKTVDRNEGCRILKDVAAISIVFMLNFTAFSSMQNLQSSLNLEEGLGTAGLSTIYATLVLSVLFLPAPVTKSLGCKWAIVLAIVPYILYMVANFHATWWTIIPSSALVGAGAAILWPAKCSLLTSLGRRYSEFTNTAPEVFITRFFGVFFMCFQSAQIWGSLIAAFVLQTELEGGSSPNGSLNEPEQNQLEHCGASWCGDDASSINNTNLSPPDSAKIYALCATYTALGILAVILASLLINDDRGEKRPTKGSRVTGALALTTFKHMRHGRQICLIPITVYSGLEQAFFAGDFTKSYVSCVLGIWMIGLVVIAYAITNTICCLILSGVAKHVKRQYIFLLGALLHLAAQITLLVWKPHVDDIALMFTLAGIWGAGDAIWNTQINALYGCIFPAEPEGAFSNYRLWEAVGFIVAFGYSSYLCTNIKLYVLIIALLLGTFGLFIVEKWQYLHASRTQ